MSTVSIAPPDFTFDEKTHTYRLGYMVLESVTEVIRDHGFIRETDDFYLNRGSVIHRACELYIRDGLLPEKTTLHSDLHGYVHSLIEFMELVPNPEMIAIEKPAYHPLYLYAGTPDIVVRLAGWEQVWDIKSGSYERWHEYQTAGYDLMLGSYAKGLRKRAGLYLQQDGSIAELIPHQADTNDGAVFLAMLTTTRARRQSGINPYKKTQE